MFVPAKPGQHRDRERVAGEWNGGVSGQGKMIWEADRALEDWLRQVGQILSPLLAQWAAWICFSKIADTDLSSCMEWLAHDSGQREKNPC